MQSYQLFELKVYYSTSIFMKTNQWLLKLLVPCLQDLRSNLPSDIYSLEFQNYRLPILHGEPLQLMFQIKFFFLQQTSPSSFAFVNIISAFSYHCFLLCCIEVFLVGVRKHSNLLQYYHARFRYAFFFYPDPLILNQLLIPHFVQKYDQNTILHF